MSYFLMRSLDAQGLIMSVLMWGYLLTYLCTLTILWIKWWSIHIPNQKLDTNPFRYWDPFSHHILVPMHRPEVKPSITRLWNPVIKTLIWWKFIKIQLTDTIDADNPLNYQFDKCMMWTVQFNIKRSKLLRLHDYKNFLMQTIQICIRSSMQHTIHSTKFKN
jgi:hypothetical protein